MRCTAGVTLVSVWVLLAGAAAGEEKPRPTGVESVELAGARRIEAILPGPLVSYAFPERADGRREIVLLVAPAPPDPSEPEEEEPAGPCEKKECTEPPAPAPRSLVRFDHSGGGALEILRVGLPADTAALDAADLDGDRNEEVLLIRPGEIRRFPVRERGEEGAGPRLQVFDPEIALEGVDPRIVRFPRNDAGSHLPVPVLGGVRFYGPVGEGAVWGLVSEVELPIDVRRRGGALRISSPLVRVVGRTSGGRLLFAVGPEAHGSRRLHTILIDPLAGEEGRRVEVWSRLPAPERLLESSFSILDGRPALIATTRSAKKLSLFEEKLLRVWYLDEPDRTRAGSRPVHAVESGANLWQMSTPSILDVNGDGLEDLVLAYWKGLKDDRVVLDAYLRQPGGGFARSAGSTQFEVEDADRFVLGYGRDLDGDGLAELLLRAGGRMLIFPGVRPGRKGKGLVEKNPRWELPGEQGSSQTARNRIAVGEEGTIFSEVFEPFGSWRLVDLDGDGREEILALARSIEGRGFFQVTFLSR